MRTVLRHAVACAIVSTLTALPALAADGPAKPLPPVTQAAPAPAGESQQDRMRRCNATAKEKALKGDERKAYMSVCLKG